MWAMPGGLLQLSEKVYLRAPEDSDGAEIKGCRWHSVDTYNSVKNAKKAGEAGLLESEPVDKVVYQALLLFANPVLVDFRVLSCIKELTGCDPVEFVSNWFHKGALTSFRARG